LNDIGTLVAVDLSLANNFSDALEILADINTTALVCVFARFDNPEGLAHGLVAFPVKHLCVLEPED
jgi:hypothetical protein